MASHLRIRQTTGFISLLAKVLLIRSIFFTDEEGKRVSKKPAGRSHQRDVESVATAVTEISADSNTMISHRLLQVDQELQIASSSHNLRIIQLLQSNATSEEEKSLVDDYYKEFLLHEGDLLRRD